MRNNQLRHGVVAGFILFCGMLGASEYVWMAEPASGEWSTNAPNWDAGAAWPDPGRRGRGALHANPVGWAAAEHLALTRRPPFRDNGLCRWI